MSPFGAFQTAAVLVKLDPLEITQRFMKSDDGYYHFQLPGGDRIHGVLPGWKNDEYGFFNFRVVSKKRGNPVSSEVYLKNNTVVWNIKYK